MIVLLSATLAAGSASSPPPCVAELPLKVSLTRVIDPLPASMPPPDEIVEELLSKVVFVIVAVLPGPL